MHKFLALLLLTALGQAAPVHLRCEQLENPLGIDSAQPRLSWQSDNTERDWRQAAYQILVASSSARLRGKPDVWDSGRQQLAASNGIVYAGPKLESRRRYYWMVRVWDTRGRVAQSSQSAWWEMGLLAKTDWTAKWISRRDPEQDTDLAATRWIWVAGQDAFSVPAKSRGLFRLSLDLPQKPTEAILYLIARGDFEAKLNGAQIGARKNWHEFERLDLSDQLVQGKNAIEVTVANRDKTAGLAALLKIRRGDGTFDRIGTGDKWQARMESGPPAWKPAATIGELGDKRFGDAWLGLSASLLRRDFTLRKPVRSARIYVTALGSYRLFLNGQRVGRDILTPDWTDYRKRVLYQTYDVTSMLARGANAIGAILGDGWYGSGLGWTGQRFNFGPPPPRLAAQLEIEYDGGARESIITDESWKTSQSPILRSEIYEGETYDARLEQPGWDKPGFQDAQWGAAAISDPPGAIISSQMSPTIRVTETIQPKSVSSPGEGLAIYDMGQNMVGWVTLKVSGPAGTKVHLRFAEILKPDGNIYRDNLRAAEVTDTYILRGAGEETFEPHFTYHGFRYVDVTGYPGKPALNAITGQVFHTANEFTGKFTSSNPMVNQLWLNALWGQRGNLESVPTDCPQRDERLGWMGDAQIFWRTASYNMDMAAFTHKWMRDVVEAQSPEGGFSDVSPRVIDESDGAPAWGDAGVIVPWTTWLHYGDTRIIDENWDAMERWMKYIHSENPGLIREKRRNNDFGDWVPADSTTPKDLIATAYWAYDADLMSQMAHATGKETDAKRYSELFSRIREAFQKKFIRDNGGVGNGSQTSIALALYMNLAPDTMKARMMDQLVYDIEQRNGHLSTGFLGTPYLLSVLTDNGRADIAYRLLLNDTYPSWGYMISKGATTIWERWNGDRGDPSMNSFNHYALGAVVAWLYRYAAGIDTVQDAPGFKNVIIHPRPDVRLTHVRGEYDSVYGKIVSDWTRSEGAFSLKLTIPANTTATLYLPGDPNSKVTESGKTVAVQKGPPGFVTCSIGSGSYEFRVN